jgi:hypothetical protein
VFKIREEVKPIFNIKEFGGDIYIIDDLLNKKFPSMFLAYSPNNGKMYTFNCSDVSKGYWAEYIVFETTFDMINRSISYASNGRDVMKEASDSGGLFIYMVDSSGSYDVEECKYEELYDCYIPRNNTYFLYHKDKIISKKK